VDSDTESDNEDREESTKTSEQSFTCEVIHAVILGRSDKRKDRVEISPEMLIEATLM